MARNNNTSNTNFQTLIPCIADNAHGLELTSVRQIVSKTTGKTNFVLVFSDKAEVVMPGNWAIRETEFPNGLYVGIKLDAYWEKNEKGANCFHLSPA